jgi:hypothetical protein
VVQFCSNLVIVLAREDVEVTLHAYQTMTKQFQLFEWGHCIHGKLHRCSEMTSGSWDAPEYPTCPCSNSSMNDNNRINRILYHDIAAQTTTEALPCLTLGPGIPDCRLPGMFFKRKLFLL